MILIFFSGIFVNMQINKKAFILGTFVFTMVLFMNFRRKMSNKINNKWSEATVSQVIVSFNNFDFKMCQIYASSLGYFIYYKL